MRKTPSQTRTSGNVPVSLALLVLLFLIVLICASDHVVSCSSGHQVSEGRGMNQSRQYLEERGKKLSIQREEESTNDEPQVLRNVRAYINGFLSDTTDIEMKRIVLRAGGQILYDASSFSPIVCSLD